MTNYKFSKSNKNYLFNNDVILHKLKLKVTFRE